MTFNVICHPDKAEAGELCALIQSDARNHADAAEEASAELKTARARAASRGKPPPTPPRGWSGPGGNRDSFLREPP